MSMMMPPGGPGGGPPPELMDMLAAAGGGDPGVDPMAQPDMGGANSDNPVDLLRQAIDAVMRFMTVEPDDVDSHAASKVLAGLQAILAKEQKDMETATGVGPQERFLAKATNRG